MNAVFSYQTPSEKQLDNVSNILGAVIAFIETENERSSVKDELPKPQNLSDDVLANTPVPENTLTSNINNFCAKSVFNNCTVDFCHEKK